MDQVRALESRQGKRHALVNLFTNRYSSTKSINNLANRQLLNVWNIGNVPVIAWEPNTEISTSADIVVRIKNGEDDAYTYKHFIKSGKGKNHLTKRKNA